MIQEPALSPYDLQFRLFGFPIRVTWGFWVAAAVLGWNMSQVMHLNLELLQLGSPGPAGLLLVWAAAIFLSILVHELGHALAMRFYGSGARIVLYHFGGLAINDSFSAWDGARRRQPYGPAAQLVISAAGPIAQILLAILVWAIAVALRIDVSLTHLIERFVILPIAEPVAPSSGIVYAFVEFVILPSLFWAVLNLLPVLPLDGGRILQQLLHLSRRRDPDQIAMAVSLVTAGLVALWGFRSGQTGMGMMFMFLAISNYQSMQQRRMGPW